MDHLPDDPAILLSSVNMLLRDGEFDSLPALCYAFGREPEEVKAKMQRAGYTFSEEQQQFRPIGFDGKEARS